MKQITGRTPILILFTTLCFHLTSYAGDHVPGQVIVLLHPGKDVNTFIGKHSGVSNQTSQLNIAKEISAAMNIWLLNFNPSADETSLLNSIREDGDVAAAQFNYLLEQRIVPNDSLFPEQDNLNNTGQQGGTPGADVRADSAWNITTGGVTALGDTIVIAVIDCGFDLTHPDLDFWKNYKEIPGNGIDDDGDGYIDDYDGWSAAGNDSIPVCFHGTHVAGIAGARGNNTIGITGVNWNVKIMPLYYGGATDAEVIVCYSYICQMRKLYNTTNGIKGAFIVSTNSSFGINEGKPADHPVWCAMYDSLGAVGILSAAAGPNNAVDVDSVGDIPTTCPSDWLIAVTNTTNTDNLNSSAGWGPVNMDLGAPGTNIWSTLPGDQYGQLSGTSMSSPHVAGAVALMWAAACEEMIADYKKNPSALATVMKTIMLNNVDTIPSLENKTVSNGRLNLYKSLLGVKDYCKKYPPPKPFSNFIYPNPAFSIAYIDFPYSAEPLALQVTDVLGRYIYVSSAEKTNDGQDYKTLQINLTGLRAGVYFVRLGNDNSTYSFTHKLIVK